MKNHRENSKDTPAKLKNPIRIEKTHENRKDRRRTHQNSCIFRKFPYLSPGKLLKTMKVHEKSGFLQRENSKATPETTQNLLQTLMRSIEILRKSSES